MVRSYTLQVAEQHVNDPWGRPKPAKSNFTGCQPELSSVARFTESVWLNCRIVMWYRSVKKSPNSSGLSMDDKTLRENTAAPLQIIPISGNVGARSGCPFVKKLQFPKICSMVLAVDHTDFSPQVLRLRGFFQTTIGYNAVYRSLNCFFSLSSTKVSSWLRRSNLQRTTSLV